MRSSSTLTSSRLTRFFLLTGSAPGASPPTMSSRERSHILRT
jgi:hypothetical protein